MRAKGKSKPDYIKLKSPDDILSYVQRLLNRLRREDLEIDQAYLGKIIYLLNTWLSAYKSNLENIEVKQLHEELEELKRAVRRSGIGVGAVPIDFTLQPTDTVSCGGDSGPSNEPKDHSN